MEGWPAQVPCKAHPAPAALSALLTVRISLAASLRDPGFCCTSHHTLSPPSLMSYLGWRVVLIRSALKSVQGWNLFPCLSTGWIERAEIKAPSGSGSYVTMNCINESLVPEHICSLLPADNPAL